MKSKLTVKYARRENAFQLAEKYRDFQILVNLSLEDIDKASRLADYTARFTEEFTHVLFATYVDKGILANQPGAHTRRDVQRALGATGRESRIFGCILAEIKHALVGVDSGYSRWTFP